MEKEKTATNAGTLLTDHVPLATGICSLCPPGIPQIPPFHNDLSPQGSAQSLPIYLLAYFGVKKRVSVFQSGSPSLFSDMLLIHR